MNLITIFPEIILFAGALIILMLDVFFGKHLKNPARLAFIGSIIFSVTSPFISLVKIIVILLLITVFLVSENFIQSEKRISAEFVALIMIATSGSLLLISANDLIAFYMALVVDL